MKNIKTINYAQYIIQYTLNHHLSITNLQLNKIMYIFATEYVNLTNYYPYTEYFKCYDYGPVFPTVYSAFEYYGSLPINSFEVTNCNTFNWDTLEFENIPYNEQMIDDIYKNIVKNYISSLLEINVFNIVDYLKQLEDVHPNILKMCKLGNYSLKQLIQMDFNIN